MDTLPSSDSLYLRRPVDQGFSWVICFASFVCYFISGVCNQTMSVLFLDLAREFKTSFTLTSLGIVFQVIFVSLSSIISVNLWVPRFGERRITIVAGLLLTLSTIGCSLAPDIFTFITCCALQGLSLGAFSVPVIGILGFYFDKRLALAISLGTSGRCVASIVAPHLIRALNEEYGVRGTYLVLAGLHLHVVAVGLMLRPSWSQRSTQFLEIKLDPSGSDAIATGSNQIIEEKIERLSTKEINRRRFESLLLEAKRPKMVTISDPSLYKKTSKSSEGGSSLEMYRQLQTTKRGLIDSSSVDPVFFKRNNSEFMYLPRHADSTLRSTKVSSYSTYPSGFDSVRSRRFQLHSGSISIASTVESAASAFGTREDTELDKLSGWRKMLQFELFTQWTFCFFLVVTLAGATNRYLLLYIPTIAIFKGATKEEGVTILTVCGSVDLASRIFVGCIADKHLVRPTQIVSVAQTFLGILCQLNPFFNDFNSLIVMGVLVGLFVGTRESLLPVMLIDLVGLSKMTNCISVNSVVSTFSIAVHNPILGYVVQKTGSFRLVLHYVGGTLFASAVGLFVIPLVQRLDKKSDSGQIESSEVFVPGSNPPLPRDNSGRLKS
ncbi:monocarboxylate transporter 3 [Biomphalaria glabrata]|uniref:Uncharacterized protein LOC106071641 isoform X1 n=1 Tax=Biomphalaria glabrata TaxID=6526 RepID=A0A9W3AJQ5_BIOGL|nr:uncharacterized protein LOC106071641 isoform X1 [Biomphalaria glabrata]